MDATPRRRARAAGRGRAARARRGAARRRPRPRRPRRAATRCRRARRPRRAAAGGCRRPGLGTALIVALLVTVLAGGYLASQAVYFVGPGTDGFVTLYRGVPVDLPAGIGLYQEVYVSGVSDAQLTDAPALDDLRAEPALPRRRRRLRAPARAGLGRHVRSARNRELLGLIPASLLVTAGFAAVLVQERAVRSDASLTYGAVFLGLCLAAHLVIRVRLPDADPYLFPLVAVLASVGLVIIYRLDETLAREQAQWFVVGLAFFAATIVAAARLPRARALPLPDRRRQPAPAAAAAHPGHRRAGQRRLPRRSRSARCRSSRPSSRRSGSSSSSRATCATRAQLLVERKVGPLTIPRLKHLGPLLLVWGLAMVMLVFIRDLGSSLMFFGGFLAMLYVATNRLIFPIVGLGLFAAGAWFFSHVRRPRAATASTPGSTRSTRRSTTGSAAATSSRSRCSRRPTAGCGAGVRRVAREGRDPARPGDPAARRRRPTSSTRSIVNELGLVGACALLLVYLLFVERGFRIAVLARDSFCKLLATGLTTVVALQVFVIVGGVTKVIPLTGVTLPVRLLRRLVDRRELRHRRAAAARLRPRPARGPRVNGPIVRVFGVTLVLFALLIAFTSRWAVFERDDAAGQPAEQARADRAAADRRAAGSSPPTADARALGAPRRTARTRAATRCAACFAHPVGYSYLNPGNAGLERFYNGELLGRDAGRCRTRCAGSRASAGRATTCAPRSTRPRSRSRSTGSPAAPGAVVALDPRTGRVKVMASVPGYDPNTLRSAAQTTRLNTAPGSPLFNRVTQAGYPPGSTFKVVTAIAAIDSGTFAPDSVVDGRNGVEDLRRPAEQRRRRGLRATSTSPRR